MAEVVDAEAGQAGTPEPSVEGKGQICHVSRPAIRAGEDQVILLPQLRRLLSLSIEIPTVRFERLERFRRKGHAVLIRGPPGAREGASGVTIDGKAIALASGAKSAVAVLPLAHKIRFNGSQMLEGQAVAVDAFRSSDLSVPYQPALTSAGLAAAKAAIKSAFDACAKSTTFTQNGCPQKYDAYFVSSPQWQLVGDPLQDVTISFDQDLNASGTGHYQLEIAYQEAGSPGTHHDISSGGYRANLLIATTSVAVASISAADGLPALQRPAGASDQTAKDIVSKALTQCAGLQLQIPPDCPQQIIAAGAYNVRWTLSGDPMAGATVTFDQKTGVFTVHGSFSMSASYDWLGNAENAPSAYPAYDALLCWDGQAFVLVTIQSTDS
jgi:hypothetical protein